MIVDFIVVWVVLWWLVLFMILPVGAQPDPNPETGHAVSAPKNPRIKLKMIVATIVSVVLTSIYFYLVIHEIIDIEALVN